MTEPATASRSLYILVVEDDEDHAELILHAVGAHSAGHRAKHVSDGRAALDFLFGLKAVHKRHWPNLVLLDLKLPKVDGLEVLDQVKQDEALRSLPVVVLTTSDAESDRAQAYHFHANSYIVKPISLEKFEQLVEDLSAYWGRWDHGS